MGLIERAIGADGPGEGTGAPARPFARIDGEAFDIDAARLRKLGVYSPGASGGSQAYELRAIKRRLLRRIGFLQRAGRDPRALRNAGRQRNLILLTSTRPGEGKSFVAMNLAMSIALEERIPVCLIDGDTARPRLRSYFGFEESPGLVDLIEHQDRDLASVSKKATGAPLSFVSEGARVSNPTELFGSAAAKRAFARLSLSYPEGIVLIDAPPVLATTETIALARLVDEVVFVVEADSTPQPAIASALDEIIEVNPNVSMVLNRCLAPAGGSYYSAYEYYEKRPAGEDAARKGAGEKA
jgi:Mrp family chromosome partitioning ATPase